MKKIFALIIGLFFITTAYAQDFGVRAGLNLSKLGSDMNSNMKPGLNVGLICDVDLFDDFYLRPGFFFEMKGYKQENGGNSNDWKANGNYFEIPILFAFNQTWEPLHSIYKQVHI